MWQVIWQQEVVAVCTWRGVKWILKEMLPTLLVTEPTEKVEGFTWQIHLLYLKEWYSSLAMKLKMEVESASKTMLSYVEYWIKMVALVSSQIVPVVVVEPCILMMRPILQCVKRSQNKMRHRWPNAFQCLFLSPFWTILLAILAPMFSADY